MTFTPEQLIGPAGLAVAAIIAVIALWRDHQRRDKRDQDLIDKLTTVVEQVPQAIKDQTAVITDWAGRIEDERAQAGRRDRRASDGR